ncbi:MAG TPA: phosphate signaling complex protein PhoU [Terriglobales bacterium]|jgi:phosphate transport system protein|nr:phosphate signaling complex protein PhoU [Terriglobales bacterium]
MPAAIIRKPIVESSVTPKRGLDSSQALVPFLSRMAQTVRSNVETVIDALLKHNVQMARTVIMSESTINAMECVIDENAVRALVGRAVQEDEARLVIATVKINNDLERMGDLAVSIAKRVISLAEMPPVETPPELIAMAQPVKAMTQKSLGALLSHDLVAATEVLESEDLVDEYRDKVYQRLLAAMEATPKKVQPNFQLLLASRYLERIADHCTNIAEDIFYWVRGVDVRHGKTHLSDSIKRGEY